MNAALLRRLRVSRMMGSGAPAPLAPTAYGSSLAAWWDPTRGTYSDVAMTTPAVADGGIGGWADQSGNGYHATQGTGASQPLLKVAFTNGLSMVQFDGVNDLLRADAAAAVMTGDDVPYTVFAVIQHTSLASNQRYLAGGNDTVNVQFTSAQMSATHYRIQRTDNSGANVTPNGDPDLATTSLVVLAFVFKGQTYDLWKNGAVKVLGEAAAVGEMTLNVLAIGALQRLATGSFLAAYMGDLILINRAATAAEIGATSSWLLSRWAVPRG